MSGGSKTSSMAPSFQKNTLYTAPHRAIGHAPQAADRYCCAMPHASRHVECDDGRKSTDDRADDATFRLRSGFGWAAFTSLHFTFTSLHFTSLHFGLPFSPPPKPTRNGPTANASQTLHSPDSSLHTPVVESAPLSSVCVL